ncbi:WhiB family transcriptional regulator [Streptomyces sp. TRM72054]|uniref:WhiB family transcriptional regulator n=1 Tax=Streptomyces sp. TRM72054 TaxID=2870562 RepID=UPI001C8BFFE9|nr:WhiB family transcriptional regulator [Streptomyces sp. TRM72054]MBX9392226.1 WhiB family transcriptional regulator [Streptomyces sp. TRM72054]
MTHYNGSVPETKRKPDWRDQAACGGNDTDVWFPHPTNHRDVQAAKQGCFSCPVMFQCAQYALSSRIPDGVWGGLSEGQRNNIHKKHRTDEFNHLPVVRETVLHTLREELNPVTSLRDLWDDNTRPLPGGHIEWASESTHVTWRGITYTPKQLAFIVDRGHKAVGVVRRLPEMCPVVECIHPQHIADNEERWHRKQAEERAAAQAAARAQYAAAEQVAV